MQFYRCRCGKAQSWTSMGVSACHSCKHCGSDLAQSESGHADAPSPHEYVDRWEPNTGEKYQVCRGCMRRRVDIEKPAEPEPPPEPPPDPYLALVDGGWPHCDQRVLHPVASCEYCALPEYAVLHEWRATHGINYTGESDPSKKPCPAESARPKSVIDKWHGNRAKEPT